MIDHSPLISVCIANYNGMGVIDECLQSVIKQEGPISVEILVHDDASSDGSVDHIRSQYPQARLIISDGNVGFCVANNRMAAAAKGKYLLLLNNDAALYPDALQTLLAEASQLGKPAVLGLPQYDANSGNLIDVGSWFDLFLNPIPNQNRHPTDVGMVIGACLWVPVVLWNELDGFPAWFHTLAEDMYLCCRARLLGYPVRVLPSSGFRHHVGYSLGGGKVTSEGRLVTSRKRRSLSERNKAYVMVLTYPWPMFYLLFPLHLAALLAEGVLLALLNREAGLLREIYLAAFKGLWAERARLFRLRRELQRSRCVGVRTFFAVFRWFPQKLRLLQAHGIPDVR
jgi:GT2 family glycosyltransferase